MPETLHVEHPRFLGHPWFNAGALSLFIATFAAVQFLVLIPPLARAFAGGGTWGAVVLVGVLVASGLLGLFLAFALSSGYGGPPEGEEPAGPRRRRARAAAREGRYARSASLPALTWLAPSAASLGSFLAPWGDPVLVLAGSGLLLSLAWGVVGLLRARRIAYVITDESLLVQYAPRLVVEDLPLPKVRNILVVRRGLGRLGGGGDLVVTLPVGSPIKAKEDVGDPAWREVGYAARNRFHLVGLRRPARFERLLKQAVEIHDLPESERRSRLLAWKMEREVPFSPAARSPDE